MDFKYLRSSPSRTHSFARFYNNTRHPVSLVWIDYSGKGVIYRDPLQPKQWLDVNTFAGHKWVFVRSGTTEWLQADKRDVWIGEPWTNHCGANPNQARRRLIVIDFPLYSLKECSLNVVRRILEKTNQSADGLCIPKSLVTDLKTPYFQQLMPFTERIPPSNRGNNERADR